MPRMPEALSSRACAASRGICTSASLRSRIPAFPHLLIPALLLAGLSACHFAPPHAQPPLPTPPLYDASLTPSGTAGARAAAIGWREYFRDPRLDALIATALDHNRDLQVAVGRIDVARGVYRIQGADRYPTIMGTAGVTRTHSGGSASGFPGGQEFTLDRASIGANVSSFELDFWGRVRDLTEAARAQYLSTVHAQRAFQLSLIQDVAAAYFAQLETAEQIRLADTTVLSRREVLRIATVRQRAGLTSALDLRSAESLLAQAQAARAALGVIQAQVNSLLLVLVGGPVAEPLPPPISLEQQTDTTLLGPGLPSELLLARPDILAAEENLRGAEANIGAARAAFFPSISLTGAWGLASSALNTLVGLDGLTWNAGANATTPIFNRGRLRGNLDVARAQDRIALAEYERTIQGAFREVTDALAGRRYLAEQVAAQERAAVAQRSIAQLARTRYIEGVANYLEVLDAERNLFTTEQQLLRLRRTNEENLVALYIALGGGVIERR
jgi:outer membrane protein, multidrug efflux system